jgi:hypothetical protein
MIDAYLDGMTWQERDIADDVDKLHRARTFKRWSEPTWNARHERVRALSEAFGAAGYRARLAEYDLDGNCTLCREAGRCPGVHITGRIQYARTLATQQALPIGLPLWGAA